MRQNKRYYPDSVAIAREDRQGAEIVATYLSPGQAARIAGVSAQQMSLMAREHRIYAIRTPLGWLFEPGCVERYAADRHKRLRAS